MQPKLIVTGGVHLGIASCGFQNACLSPSPRPLLYVDKFLSGHLDFLDSFDFMTSSLPALQEPQFARFRGCLLGRVWAKRVLVNAVCPVSNARLPFAKLVMALHSNDGANCDVPVVHLG